MDFSSALASEGSSCWSPCGQVILTNCACHQVSINVCQEWMMFWGLWIIAAVGNMQPSAHHSLGLSVSGCGSCASVSAAWGGWQHHPLIIFTFCTFLILFLRRPIISSLDPLSHPLYPRCCLIFFEAVNILSFLSWLFFYLFWRRLATSSLILFDVFLFFEAVNILPWSSWMFVSLLEEAGNILLSFSISWHVCWGQQNAILIHFLLSLTFLADNIPPSHFLFLFRGGQQHHVLSFCFLKLIEADTIPFWSSWFS